MDATVTSDRGFVEGKAASRRWEKLSAALVLLGCAVAVIPFAPSFPAADLDGGWKFAVNAAVGQGLAFGRDLIFTFGPYASVYTLNYHPATDRLDMVASLLLAVALAAGLVALTPDRGRWRAMLLALLLSLLLLRDPLFFVTPLVFLAVVARVVAIRGPPARRLIGVGALLVTALALLPLIKGTFVASAAVGLGLGGLLLLVRGRWHLAVAAGVVFLAAMMAFWLSAGQALADLPLFFAAQGLIVSGYTEAMSLPGPLWQVGVFAAVALALLLLNLGPAVRAGLPGLAVLAGAAMLLLLAFKGGFVRQDVHVATAAGSLGLIAGMLAVANRGLAPALGLVVGLAGWGVLEHSVDGLGPRRALLRVETTYRDAAAGALDRLRGGAALRKNYADALAQIRAGHRLPPLTGSSDIYSAGQSILLAYGLPWSPRPVLQSYSAYSPALEEDNARHLMGQSAPQNVLIALDSIDNRLPALEDGLSWLPLLARYEATALQGDMAILRHSAATAPSALGPRQPPLRHGLGEAVPLDRLGDAPLWAEIDVRPTLLGRALAALFRPPPLSIVMRLTNGRTVAFRYVPGMGRAGFVISPLVGSAAQLLTLQLPGEHVFGDYQPASFSIEGDGRYWRSGYTATLTPLHFQFRPSARTALFQVPQPATSASDADAKCQLDLVDGQVADHAKPLALTGLVRLTGWGFGGTAMGVEPDSVAVSLRGADGAVVAAPAMFQARPDVGLYLHQPQLSRVGYQALLDLRALSGSFGMALELTVGAHRWRCSLAPDVEITRAQP